MVLGALVGNDGSWIILDGYNYRIIIFTVISCMFVVVTVEVSSLHLVLPHRRESFVLRNYLPGIEVEVVAAVASTPRTLHR